ncbi:DUF2478 domain-containing protein [Phenylobacterium sp.]|uniref:DUF2478 domain-containing protein n=1 Tax=Phenylobacterium sp. TaxID=1871053 RepID=UPI002896DCB9|nr:DUF2478 domain-containing protein [Phenylobacterium sp.]
MGNPTPDLARPIAVVRGAPTPAIQSLFCAFAQRLGPRVRVAGVVEEEPGEGEAQLRSLVDGRRFPVFQELGGGSTACGLDAGSIVTACEAVRQDIAAGCDLVVLSKFGRLEAERTGLSDAFAAGLAARTPILTSVAQKFDPVWSAFAAPLYVVLPPDLAAIEGWWRSLHRQVA